MLQHFTAGLMLSTTWGGGGGGGGYYECLTVSSSVPEKIVPGREVSNITNMVINTMIMML